VVERSDTTGYEMGVKAACTPAGVQDLMPRCPPVVSSLTLLNHRLLAAMPPESSRSKSVINGRDDHNVAERIIQQFSDWFIPSRAIGW